MFFPHPTDHLVHPLGYAQPSLESTALESLLLLPPESGKHVEKRLSEMLGRLKMIKVSVSIQSKCHIKNVVQERGRGEEDEVGEDLGNWGKGNGTATCLQVVSQSSIQHPQHTPQSGHPCNNRAATGERDKERQTNRRKKERKQRVSNKIGRYDCMMSPSSVASLRVIAMFVLLLPSGWLQNTEKATPGTGQAYTWNHTFKKREEGSISFSSETYTFLSLWKKCLMENPPEDGRSISRFCSISFTLAGNLRMHMCHRMPQKTYPMTQCAQGTRMSRAECGLMLKVLPCWVCEWVRDHPVKHCAVVVKMVIIIKKSNW